MSKLTQLQSEWKDFNTDRTRARLEVSKKLDAINEEQARLNAEKAKLQIDFQDHWKKEKERRREAFDTAVMKELAAGRSGQEILRELGSSNTVWIYGLRQRVLDQFGNLQPASGGESTEPQPDASIDGVMWEHSDHEGVHGVLVDTSRNYIKKYGTPGSEFDGEWFVADMTGVYVGGNKQLYEATGIAELTKRVTMLTQLLDGNYKGRLKLSPNPYRA